MKVRVKITFETDVSEEMFSDLQEKVGNKVIMRLPGPLDLLSVEEVPDV